MLEFLDVAIGLIFVFASLSLIASALSEWVAATLSLRGRMLWRAIERLVGATAGGKLLEHQLIKGLAHGSRLRGEPAPSYVPSELFALALMQQFMAKSEGPRDMTHLRVGLTVAARDATTQETASALLALMDDATSLDEARTKIAAWYDAAMTRLSGLYKRWTQVILFGIGLTLAVSLGVDARAIATSLWENPSLRASTVELAAAFAEQADKTEAAADAGDDDCGIPLPRTEAEQGMCNAQTYAKQLQRSRLPLDPFGRSGKTRWEWLGEHWLGFLLSAAATALGAPFWFDLLGRFLGLRTSIKPTLPSRRPKPPARSPTQEPRDEA